MKLRTGLVVLIVGLGIQAAAAQSTSAPKPAPPSVAARLDALEKQNAALTEQIAGLQELLTRTRMELAQAIGNPAISAAGAYVPPPSFAPLTSRAMSTDPQIQNQINQNTIQQQQVQTQLGNLQLQQSIDQDRLREQQMQNMAPR